MSEKKREMVTSLRVDPDLWKEVKVEAIRRDMTLGEAIEEALKCWIKEQGQKERR